MYRKGRKVLIICLLFALGIPVFYYTTKYSLAYMGPELYEGDRQETRACRMCGGSGKDPEMARDYPQLGDRCPFCAGKGTVTVILPGPRRPTRIWGGVVDAGAAGDVDFAPPKLRQLPSPILPENARRLRGSIEGATLIFMGGPEEIVVKTDRSGRFSQRIPPGSYTVKATAPGFAPAQGEIEVKPLTEPLWMERATLIQEPKSYEEAQSNYGLELLVGLSREGEGDFFRLTAGSP